jgi:hypothetical protein
MFPYQSKLITDALKKISFDINKLHTSFEETVHKMRNSPLVSIAHTREWSLIHDCLKRTTKLLTASLKCQAQSLTENKLWFYTLLNYLLQYNHYTH